MSKMMLSKDLFALLKQHINLPDGIVSMRLVLGVDTVAEVECTFHAHRSETDVTSLSSVAKEYVVGAPGFDTKRYELVEVVPGGRIRDQSAVVNTDQLYAAIKAAGDATLRTVLLRQRVNQ